MRPIIASVIGFLLASMQVVPLDAAELRVAVASNFASTARSLVTEYATISDDSVVLLVGSTGKHASQIRYGLDVDVFLSADSARPKFLEDNGFAVRGSRATYALGRLALWSKDASLVDKSGDILSTSRFKYLAIANPKTAPYGIAAQELLSKLGVFPSIVNGESVAQAFQFANSGSAELALISFAQVKGLTQGSQWLVPADLHGVIEQQSVLVNDTRSARGFLAFLKSEKALTIIESSGYLRP